MILIPEPGKRPERADPAFERILHVALRTPFEGQPGLAKAQRGIADEYNEIDWQRHEATLAQTLLEKVQAFRPTLVFMQLQRATPITAAVVREIRARCRSCVVVNWDGDQHYEPTDPERRWFVELGKECDASLVVNTKHPAEYADLGVRNPGYLQIGIDGDIYHPTAPDSDAVDVVFLASNYVHIPAYDRRREMVARLSAEFGERFAVYGSGWGNGHEMLKQHAEPGVYAGAHCAISTSIRADLPRYSSDRLFRALGSGAVALVEHIPDSEGLGLSDGENCYLWRTHGELISLARSIIAAHPRDHRKMRANAALLVAERHTWKARMAELSWIVERVRASRAV